MAIAGRETFISSQASMTFKKRGYISLNKPYDLLCARSIPFLETPIFVSGVHTSVPLQGHSFTQVGIPLLVRLLKFPIHLQWMWYTEVAGLYYWLLWTTYVIDFCSMVIKKGTRIMPIRDRGLIRNRGLQGLSWGLPNLSPCIWSTRMNVKKFAVWFYC